jgi:hypothetical protein
MAESSFPQSLDFSPQPLAISARSYMAKCVPESSSTGRPNEIVRIRIPSGRAGSYLNNSKSFLSFEVVNDSTCPKLTASVGVSDTPPLAILRDSKLHLDGSAYAVIQTQEVYNSSNLLESIQNANVLYNMLVDLQTSMGSRLTGSKILGIGATNVNQAWNTYHGQTLSVKADVEQIYTAFNRNYPTGSGNNYSIANTIYAGLNILQNSTVLGATGDAQRILAQTVVEGNGAGVRPIVQEVGGGIAAYPGPININFPFGQVGCQAGSLQRAGQAAALDQGANGVSSFISRLGPVVPYGQKQRFCLPLVSGVVGSLCCKLFPLHALNSDLMLHFTLASNNTVACNDYIPTTVDTSAGAPGVPVGGITGDPILFTPSYRLEQIAYHACIVEVSAQAQAMLDQATGGQYVIPSASYRNFTHTLQAGTSVNEFPVPARFTSVKSIVACQRPSSSLDRADRFSLTSRIKNNMTAIQYRVGSLLVPQEPIKMGNIDPSLIHPRSGTAPEAFAHLLEAIGQCVSDRTLECGLDDAIYGANHDGADYDYGDTPGSGVTTPYDWVQQVNVGGGTAEYFAAAQGTIATLAKNGQSDRRYYQRMAVGSTAGFCWGLDMESFNSAMCHGPLQSGTNTLGLNIMCRLYADSLQTETGGTVDVAKHMVATQVDHWVCFDQVLVVSGGVCSTRF